MNRLLPILKALADGQRLRVLAALARRPELCVCQITEMLGLATPTVSRHMSILQAAGLVRSRKQGRWVDYRLAPAHPAPSPFPMLEWIGAGLENDPQIQEDRHRLEGILPCNPAALASCCEPVPAATAASAAPATPADFRPKVLFLCTGNSCRSQMAEGWARHLAADRLDPYSAGIETHDLNPLAVKVMAEAGVDISGHRSKLLSELDGVAFDHVVTVCGHAHEHCPRFPARATVLHVGFDDPPRLASEAKNEEEALGYYRRVRDEIRRFVVTLPDALTPRPMDQGES